MPTATLTSKGQVTIPKEIRDRLKLKKGDRVDFRVDAAGDVRLIAQNKSVLDRIGFAKHLSKRTTPVTIEEMDKAIGDAIAEEYVKGLKR